MSEDPRFKGLEIELHRYSGARVLRVVHPGRQQIDEHRHGWAYIGIYTAGHYREQYDGGEADMRGPCAVLHPAGRPHADIVHESGLETLTIEFDPSWLRLYGFTRALDCSRVWSGGATGLSSRRLAGLLISPTATEHQVGQATADFLARAMMSEPAGAPAWLGDARHWLTGEDHVSTHDLARRLDLHPAYMAQAYRQATGEGIGETLRRRRVEMASSMLRGTTLPLADIAAASGFCDQSHMNRCFAVVLGRTPLRIRHERRLFEERAANGAH